MLGYLLNTNQRKLKGFPMKIRSILAGALLAFLASNANAALFNFTGQIGFHNDVVFINFGLDSDATDVRVWTDSFLSGDNFDPITALWNADTGALIAENDDNASINPDTQTFYDSGFALPSLDAGNYIFSVATFANFASGAFVADGFTYDDQDPIALADWDQPANDINMGPNWSVWLDGVDTADDNSNPVPSPAMFTLVLLGLAFLRLRTK